MFNKKIANRFKYLFLALVLLLGASGESSAATFWLRADTMTKAMPDGSVVTMWGFANCTDGTFATCDPATVPGPALTVPTGDTTLTINLMNNLTGLLTEPVSIVIPGQIASMAPQKFADTKGRQRVRSFTSEAQVGGTATYTWNSLKPGTYLYESGTHPAVQIQMGLYGAVKKDAAAGQAYGASTAYANEVILLFSEIDPALHNAVATGNYGPGKAITSTMHYEPKFFLVNGEPFSFSASPILAGAAGQTTLLRLLNAGIKDHTPVIQDLYMTLYAEDGNPFPYPKRQYSTLLPAGKTIDAIITPAAVGYYPVHDRKLSLTNGAASPGGMMAYLKVPSAQNTLSVATVGGGKVLAASLPGGIDCGLDCTEDYNAGTTLTLTAVPVAASTFIGWSGACTGTGDCIVTMDAAKSVTAQFSPAFTITATAGKGGTITPSGAVLVATGRDQAFNITPDIGRHIVDVVIDGSPVGAVTSYTFTNVQANHTIAVAFSVDTFTITATAGAGGIIAPTGVVIANYGTSKTFNITASTGSTIQDVLVDGVSVGVVPTYTFSNITSNHTISASFSLIPDIMVSGTPVNLKRIRLMRTAQKALSIKNIGLANLEITSAEIIGDASFQLKNWSGSPTLLAPGAVTNIKLLFRPTSRGQKAATLRITSNDPDTPVVEIPLSGGAS